MSEQRLTTCSFLWVYGDNRTRFKEVDGVKKWIGYDKLPPKCSCPMIYLHGFNSAEILGQKG